MAPLNISNRNTPRQREQLFIQLYRSAFPAVAHYVNKMGGSLDEAKDVFQDALVCYYERMVNNSGKSPDNEKAYLLGIAKYLWIKRYKENLPNIGLDDHLPAAELAEFDEDSRPSATRLLHYLETAGEKCLQLLKTFYYDQLPLTEIATLFGYSSPHSATVQKYKCLEKVRNTVKEKSLTYEDFIA